MKRKVKIIGVPMDLGADRRGVDMGPSVVRIAGLNRKIADLGYEVEDLGNVRVTLAETASKGDKNAKYLKEVAEANEELAAVTYGILQDGAMPIILGGDHSIAIGSVSGIAKYYRELGHRIGIIWIDAHLDMNTPQTSPSGNIHGMPLAVLLGYGPPELTEIGGFCPKVYPEDCVIIGARDVDAGERELARKIGVKVFSMSDLDEIGIARAVDEAIRIATRNTIGFHATFDIDFVDPTYAPGVGTPVPGGGTYRESHLAMEKIFDSGKALSIEVTEINAVLDTGNKTGELGAELILSALGKKIM
ncbi:MAG: arginase [Acidobacteriota bacterium]|nr:arginase [Blastocatellia bacterium]MDW8413324.1 arginase [Acidobacteriota bacterium]